MKNWFEKVYRRSCKDMHINDWHDDFLSEFDPKLYVESVKKSGTEHVILYARNLVGLSFYPTKVGHFHKKLNGRDIFGELCTLLKEANIKIVTIFGTVFDLRAVETHPEWSIIKADGNPSYIDSGHRDKHACPNNREYQVYILGQIREVCSNYKIDGLRIDMIFWPMVCYCPSCREKYKEATGKAAMPRTVNWEDPTWAEFQMLREKWINEFAASITKEARSCNPDLSVEHQVSTTFHPWIVGINSDFFNNLDYMEGDFYGTPAAAFFFNKVFYGCTPNSPYCFETSANIGLENHTILKSKELLATKQYVAIANGGAFLYIDFINPDGTFNKEVDERMKEVFDIGRPYDEYRGGKQCHDIAIYCSLNSKVDFKDNGKDVMEAAPVPFYFCNMVHIDAAMGAMSALSSRHIPFGIITKASLKDLNKFKVIILPNILIMDYEETEAIKDFVKNGGALYASKYTSLITKDGTRHENFMLSDIFGVNYLSEVKETISYMAPTQTGNENGVLKARTDVYPLMIQDKQMEVYSESKDVLATIVLPYTDPSDMSTFASIMNDPPHQNTNKPSIVMNTYGKGKCIYCTSDIERTEYSRNYFADLVNLIYSGDPIFKSDAHPTVDITVAYHEDGDYYIFNALSFQTVMPNIPIHNTKASFLTNGRDVEYMVVIPSSQPLDFKINGKYVDFIIPVIDTFTMLKIKLKK